jgi:hypothetical protein
MARRRRPRRRLGARPRRGLALASHRLGRGREPDGLGAVQDAAHGRQAQLLSPRPGLRQGFRDRLHRAGAQRQRDAGGRLDHRACGDEPAQLRGLRPGAFPALARAGHADGPAGLPAGDRGRVLPARRRGAQAHRHGARCGPPPAAGAQPAVGHGPRAQRLRVSRAPGAERRALRVRLLPVLRPPHPHLRRDAPCERDPRHARGVGGHARRNAARGHRPRARPPHQLAHPRLPAGRRPRGGVPGGHRRGDQAGRQRGLRARAGEVLRAHGHAPLAAAPGKAGAGYRVAAGPGHRPLQPRAARHRPGSQASLARHLLRRRGSLRPHAPLWPHARCALAGGGGEGLRSFHREPALAGARPLVELLRQRAHALEPAGKILPLRAAERRGVSRLRARPQDHLPDAARAHARRAADAPAPGRHARDAAPAGRAGHREVLPRARLPRPLPAQRLLLARDGDVLPAAVHRRGFLLHPPPCVPRAHRRRRAVRLGLRELPPLPAGAPRAAGREQRRRAARETTAPPGPPAKWRA